MTERSPEAEYRIAYVDSLKAQVAELQALLEQRELCDCVPLELSSRSCPKCGRRGVANESHLDQLSRLRKQNERQSRALRWLAEHLPKQAGNLKQRSVIAEGRNRILAALADEESEGKTPKMSVVDPRDRERRRDSYEAVSPTGDPRSEEEKRLAEVAFKSAPPRLRDFTAAEEERGAGELHNVERCGDDVESSPGRGEGKR